jgi:glutamate/tyrosine decarboxylase-like PLP-dependent enzyme
MSDPANDVASAPGHVDAAYGGPAARTSVAGALFQGLAQADSVVVNAK